MLPWAATASSSSSAAPLLHASPRPAPPSHRPSPPRTPPALSLSSRAPPRALSRGGDAFWEEPDDGSGSDYEDEGKQATGQRSSPFPSPFPSSRRAPARQQDREEQELRRGTVSIAFPRQVSITPPAFLDALLLLHSALANDCAVYASRFTFQYLEVVLFLKCTVHLIVRAAVLLLQKSSCS